MAYFVYLGFFFSFHYLFSIQIINALKAGTLSMCLFTPSTHLNILHIVDIQHLHLFCLNNHIQSESSWDLAAENKDPTGPSSSYLYCVMNFDIFYLNLFSFISFTNNAGHNPSNWYANPPMGYNLEFKKTKHDVVEWTRAFGERQVGSHLGSYLRYVIMNK